MNLNEVRSNKAVQALRTEQTSRTQQAQEEARVRNKQAETTATRKPDAEKPRPVVNTQGQTTGTTINITA